MYDHDLVRRCLRRPNTGCGGAFIVVLSNPTEGLTYDLITIVAKDIGLGRVFPVYSRISSRKMIAARMNMFNGLLKVLRTDGQQDPLKMRVHERLSLFTDLKLRSPLLLGDHLLNVFIQTKTWLTMSVLTKICAALGVTFTLNEQYITGKHL